MRIAQIAPLYESVPPRRYGGTERVVSWLTEALVAAGHDVTLFASGESTTRATLRPMVPRALWSEPRPMDPVAAHLAMIEQVFREADDFDVLHFHTDWLQLPYAAAASTPALTTLHGRLDLPELPAMFDLFPDAAVVSISDDQRAPLPHARWVATVPHGMPVEAVPTHGDPSGHLLFLGRISPEKRADRAVEIALRCGLPLKIAARVAPKDQACFDEVLAPLLDRAGDRVEFVGEVDDATKRELLCGARALLFPIDWPEPFGLVMIEALACGTPVIAWRAGAVPEVIEDGVSGFVVDDLDRACDAVRRLGSIDRRACRAAFERRFSADRMMASYVRLYRALGRAPVAIRTVR